MEAQADRPAPTTVSVGRSWAAGPGAADVTVELTRTPALDPFTGLVPGRTVEVWHARRQGAGWLVQAGPVQVQALYPSDRGAPAAVRAWVVRLLACDPHGAAALQAQADLFGPADLAAAPCRQRGRWSVGAAAGFDAAADPQPYVAAFGPDVNAWARLVPVQGPRTGFAVVVAPLGDAWRVLGTDPTDAGH
jgi:hypothetical protein